MNDIKIIMQEPKLVDGMFALFPEERDFKQLVESGTPVYFTARLETKTLVETTLLCNTNRYSVNLMIEGFNLKERQEYSHFSGFTNRVFFKRTKKQGVEEYKEYIKQVIPEIEKLFNVKFKQSEFVVINEAF